jgi:hypothetical protein
MKHWNGCYARRDTEYVGRHREGRYVALIWVLDRELNKHSFLVNLRGGAFQ